MKRIKIGEFEELVMLAVARAEHDGEAATARIQEVLHEQAGRDASLGAIYAALDRLERKGCVSSWLAKPDAEARPSSEQERAGRVRRLYRVTEDGRTALRAAQEARERLRKGIEHVLAGGGRSTRGRGR